jgi:hypothetical protein
MQTLFRVFVINVGELALRLMLLNAIFKRSAVSSVYRGARSSDDARPFVDFGFEMPSELLPGPADHGGGSHDGRDLGVQQDKDV